LVRPVNRFALGPMLAYDAQLGSHRITVGGEKTDYGRQLWRLALEARWYSRRVAVGGLFLSLQGGVAWLTDTVTPAGAAETGATQTAPMFGLGLGGAFVPYRGFGISLALQGFVTLLSRSAPSLAVGFGKAYAYGALGFIGITLSLAFGTNV
jgi:hypothetical protein